MDPNTAAPISPASPAHLVVLVHGLWGNPEHLKFLRDSLREKYEDDNLHILVAKRNAGSFTYDGIELGGERVTNEIEAHLEELAKDGHDIKRISVVGYSLGGLIARYALGLLYHKGLFERIEPVNFTTFATPHLGVRTPLTGARNHLWNVLGARTLSMSGKQLFTVDKFRDTERPLLAVLADPESIFMRALAQFKHRSLYANVVNDRTVTYYTAGISKTDPFVDIESVKCNYLEGHSPVILDSENPVSVKEAESLGVTQRLTKTTRTLLGQLPFAAFLVIFIPLGSTIFLLNSAVQSVRSGQRIRLHEEGKAGINIGEYRIPVINNMRQEVEDIYENMNSGQDQEYLPAGDEESGLAPAKAASEKIEGKRSSDFPILALTSDQFAMIQALDDVGFKKYPVYIHKHRHSHAAIIRRRTGAAFEEGRVVVKHWLGEFEL